MDISHYTNIVFDKIQRFEPEYATRITGYLLIQDNGEEDMARLASLPDHLIRELALKTRTEFQRLAAGKSPIHPFSLPINSQQSLSHLSVISPSTPTLVGGFQVSSPYWDLQFASNTNAEFMTRGYLDSISELQMQQQQQHIPLFSSENRTGRRYEFPVKTCHYFSRGYCKHGNSCRYYHAQVVPEICSHVHRNDTFNDDQFISPGSLAQLETEIVELLKLKKGGCMSIASLPMAYYDKYRKVLQADGYLTESQRHGKSGYSLTKLLVRLKNSIRVIDRPHGQHSMVLVEDAPRFNGKVDYGRYISASRQIYLTFPADSTFSEGDVSNYFGTYGNVEDVRIPSQERRMFGFVTFDDSETVKMILDKGNPHYVCESRVLVKPYKEKPKLMARKQSDRIEHPVHYSPHYVDINNEPTSIPRNCRNPREEEEEATLEFQRRRFAEMELAQRTLPTSLHLVCKMDGLKISDDHFNVQSAESLCHAANDQVGYTDNNYTDEDSNQGLNLPDSPFSFSIHSIQDINRVKNKRQHLWFYSSQDDTAIFLFISSLNQFISLVKVGSTYKFNIILDN
ncbi:Zinc finger CCCH domain-containing protein 18, partial [Mucuna pruriens]